MIDLHTHSTASDGTDTPEELVKKAHAEGVQALALTDHDTMAGLDEAQETSEGLLHFIRGCEVSTSTDYGSMHILGLWLPKRCDELQKFLDQAMERRETRNIGMLKKLQDLGIKLELEELQEIAKGCIGRPHFAKLLLQKGYVENLREAFDKYLGVNGKAYLPKYSPTPEEVIPLMKQQGATVIIAHPFLKNLPQDAFGSTISRLKSCGLDGLESWHSSQSMEQTRVLTDLAIRRELQISGGSDYHGTAKEGIMLGHIDASTEIPDFIYDRLVEDRRQNGYPA